MKLMDIVGRFRLLILLVCGLSLLTPIALTAQGESGTPSPVSAETAIPTDIPPTEIVSTEVPPTETVPTEATSTEISTIDATDVPSEIESEFSAAGAGISAFSVDPISVHNLHPGDSYLVTFSVTFTGPVSLEPVQMALSDPDVSIAFESIVVTTTDPYLTDMSESAPGFVRALVSTSGSADVTVALTSRITIGMNAPAGRNYYVFLTAGSGDQTVYTDHQLTMHVTRTITTELSNTAPAPGDTVIVTITGVDPVPAFYGFELLSTIPTNATYIAGSAVSVCGAMTVGCGALPAAESGGIVSGGAGSFSGNPVTAILTYHVTINADVPDGTIITFDATTTALGFVSTSANLRVNTTGEPTATSTSTEVPPTATITPTPTEAPPTATSTSTPTQVPPTATSTSTPTEVPPTSTPTPTEVPRTITTELSNTAPAPGDTVIVTITGVDPVPAFYGFELLSSIPTNATYIAGSAASVCGAMTVGCGALPAAESGGVVSGGAGNFSGNPVTAILTYHVIINADVPDGTIITFDATTTALGFTSTSASLTVSGSAEPTATSTSTPTEVPPTSTSTSTPTEVPPTATSTPSSTATNTVTPTEVPRTITVELSNTSPSPGDIVIVTITGVDPAPADYGFDLISTVPTNTTYVAGSVVSVCGAMTIACSPLPAAESGGIVFGGAGSFSGNPVTGILTYHVIINADAPVGTIITFDATTTVFGFTSTSASLTVSGTAEPTATNTSTPTEVPPTATSTSTPTEVPPTATSSSTPTEVPPTATSTSTPTEVPPTATETNTSTPTEVPPTATSTSTPTEAPPTATSTSTPTEAPPTATSTSTPTEIPPTATETSSSTPTEVPSTATSTSTPTEVPPTATETSTSTPTEVPPTATSTSTPTEAPPTATETSTSTSTEVPPTATSTSTPTEVPPTETSSSTPTEVPPTATSTSTPTEVPPTSTSTSTPTEVPPSATATSTSTPTEVPPTATSTSTPTEVPPTATTTPDQPGPPVVQTLNLNVAADGTVTGNLADQVSGGIPPYTFILVTAPAKGQVTISPEGFFTYTANDGENGPDSFAYSVTDSQGEPQAAAVVRGEVNLVIAAQIPSPTSTVDPGSPVGPEPTASATSPINQLPSTGTGSSGSLNTIFGFLIVGMILLSAAIWAGRSRHQS